LTLSFTEIRRNSKKFIEAMEQNKVVTLTYRGKPIATINPIDISARKRAQDCEGFGMWADREDMKDPVAWVREQRKPRYKL